MFGCDHLHETHHGITDKPQHISMTDFKDNMKRCRGVNLGNHGKLPKYSNKPETNKYWEL